MRHTTWFRGLAAAALVAPVAASAAPVSLASAPAGVEVTSFSTATPLASAPVTRDPLDEPLFPEVPELGTLREVMGLTPTQMQARIDALTPRQRRVLDRALRESFEAVTVSLMAAVAPTPRGGQRSRALIPAVPALGTAAQVSRLDHDRLRARIHTLPPAQHRALTRAVARFEATRR